MDQLTGYLRPHGLTEEPTDWLTRYLHKSIPLSMQRGFRDKGMLRFVADKSISLLALTAFPLYYSFLSLGLKQRTHNYGLGIKQKLHIIDLSSMEDTSSSSFEIEKQSRSLIFVHGGAWGSGQPWMYRLSAVTIAKCVECDEVILVEYPTYPDASIQQQVQCLILAIQYSKSVSNSREYILCGHSSGANISLLALLNSLDLRLKLTDYVILLSGVYDIGMHYHWEKERGLHIISPMSAAATMAESSFANSSPLHVIDRYPDHPLNRKSNKKNEKDVVTDVDSSIHIKSRTSKMDRIDRDSPFEQWFPNCLILHGIEDKTVPVSSSVDMASALLRKGAQIYTSYPHSLGHGDPITQTLYFDVESITALHLGRWWDKMHGRDGFPKHGSKSKL